MNYCLTPYETRLLKRVAKSPGIWVKAPRGEKSAKVLAGLECRGLISWGIETYSICTEGNVALALRKKPLTGWVCDGNGRLTKVRYVKVPTGVYVITRNLGLYRGAFTSEATAIRSIIREQNAKIRALEEKKAELQAAIDAIQGDVDCLKKRAKKVKSHA